MVSLPAGVISLEGAEAGAEADPNFVSISQLGSESRLLE